MVEEESDVEAFKDFTALDAGEVETSPQTPPAPEEPVHQEPEPAPKPAPAEPAKPAPPAKEPTPFGAPILASPVARRMALERGIPLKDITGSGPNGRIIKSDIEKFTPPAAPAAAAPAPGTGHTDIPLTGMRKTIAKRLSESMFTAPHYYLTSSINMSKTLKLRKALNEIAPKNKDGSPAYKLSVNDFIVKAVQVALLRVPEANSQWLEKEDVLRIFSYVDISVPSDAMRANVDRGGY
jgi:pyruvate dehydrogenase E2 component (dihydrolipoyllysine-residue acetyltransferase)